MGVLDIVGAAASGVNSAVGGGDAWWQKAIQGVSTGINAYNQASVTPNNSITSQAVTPNNNLPTTPTNNPPAVIVTGGGGSGSVSTPSFSAPDSVNMKYVLIGAGALLLLAIVLNNK